MEIDKEVSGNGNSYTTEFRQYDPRLGRWKSQDPLRAKYPHISPYTFCVNNPNMFKDSDGREVIITVTKNENNDYTIKVSAQFYLYGEGVTPDFVKELKFYIEKIYADGTGCYDVYDDNGNVIKTVTGNIDFDIKITVIPDCSNNTLKSLPFALGALSLIQYDYYDKRNIEDNRDILAKTPEGSNVLKIVGKTHQRSFTDLDGKNGIIYNGYEGRVYSRIDKVLTAIHEMGHLLAMRDRYKDIHNKEGKAIGNTGEISKTTGTNFTRDALGDPKKEASGFAQDHYNDILRFSVNKLNGLGGYFPQQDFIDNRKPKEVTDKEIDMILNK